MRSKLYQLNFTLFLLVLLVLVALVYLVHLYHLLHLERLVFLYLLVCRLALVVPGFLNTKGNFVT